jgi:hypothetical protein
MEKGIMKHASGLAGGIVFGLVVALAGWAKAQPAKPVQKGAHLVEVTKVWDKAPHNAFTDLIRYKDCWYLTFREGSKHVSDDGKVQVLRSEDGRKWESVALFASPDQDVRECKFSITPEGELMLSGAAHNLTPGRPNHESYAWFSTDGRHWSQRARIGDANYWMWRVAWHKGKAYCFGYSTVKPFSERLYVSSDGRKWTTLKDNVWTEGFPTETAIYFLDDDTMMLLLRRDGGTTTAQLGLSKPPYTDWTWKDLGVRIGSPDLVRLPDGRFVAAIRLLNPMRSTLCWLDPKAGTLTEFLTLPSGGDGGYQGAVYHDGLLWVSYYSSHEGHKACIYLAKVKIDPAPSRASRAVNSN